MMKDFRYGPNVDEMTLRSCVRINPDDVVNLESLEPCQNQTTMHGCIIKLYSTDRPQPTVLTADGWDGGRYSQDAGLYCDLWDPGFGHGVGDSHHEGSVSECKDVCRHGQEDILQIVHQSRSELYESPITATLSTCLSCSTNMGEAWSGTGSIDKSKTKGAQTVSGNAVTAAGINGSIQSVAANHACDAGVAGALHPRCRVYYRGVVTAALEVSFPLDLNTNDSEAQ
ncbi:MAG: hypothetical protein J3R72DRAFT_100954 [Linnemannia gamsii]|nr:MAG: hypothetical protein J3R72DRAFT_100954 [Linnemannia gamsii]